MHLANRAGLSVKSYGSVKLIPLGKVLRFQLFKIEYPIVDISVALLFRFQFTGHFYYQLPFNSPPKWKSTNSKGHIPSANKFCSVTLNICGVSVWNFSSYNPLHALKFGLDSKFLKNLWKSRLKDFTLKELTYRLCLTSEISMSAHRNVRFRSCF